MSAEARHLLMNSYGVMGAFSVAYQHHRRLRETVTGVLVEHLQLGVVQVAVLGRRPRSVGSDGDHLRGTAVVVENAPKSLSRHDGASVIRACRQRCDELVAETLVVPFCVIMHYVFGYRCPQVSLTERRTASCCRRATFSRASSRRSLKAETRARTNDEIMQAWCRQIGD